MSRYTSPKVHELGELAEGLIEELEACRRLQESMATRVHDGMPPT